MAQNSAGIPHSELSGMLTAVLSPVARTMIKREFGIGAFVRAAKLSYLNAAIEEISPTGKRANVSRLAVVTGMTRKEVASLLEERKSNASVKPPKKSLEQRALKVLRGWTSDPLFHTELGRPAELALRGEGRTFTTLVRAYGGDVTVSAVLKELERMKAVRRNRSGNLKMRTRPQQAGKGSYKQIAEFAAMMRDFSETASQLIQPSEPQKYFGFRESMLSTPAQAAHFHRIFSRRAASLLDGVEQWQSRQFGLPTRKNRQRQTAAIRVGLGVYLVHRENECAKPLLLTGTRS